MLHLEATRGSERLRTYPYVIDVLCPCRHRGPQVGRISVQAATGEVRAIEVRPDADLHALRQRLALLNCGPGTQTAARCPRKVLTGSWPGISLSEHGRNASSRGADTLASHDALPCSRGRHHAAPDVLAPGGPRSLGGLSRVGAVPYPRFLPGGGSQWRRRRVERRGRIDRLRRPGRRERRLPARGAAWCVLDTRLAAPACRAPVH